MVTITNDGQVIANYNTVAEGKLAIKELKLQKKQLNLLKRQVNEKQKAIRAAYTSEVRHRGSMVRERLADSFEHFNR